MELKFLYDCPVLDLSCFGNLKFHCIYCILYIRNITCTLALYQRCKVKCNIHWFCNNVSLLYICELIFVACILLSPDLDYLLVVRCYNLFTRVMLKITFLSLRLRTQYLLFPTWKIQIFIFSSFLSLSFLLFTLKTLEKQSMKEDVCWNS